MPLCVLSPLAGTPEDPGHSASASATPPAAAGKVSESKDPAVYGWKEWIWLQGRDKKLRAKLDTGALTSSLHATDIKPFERDGKKWVRFVVFDPKRDDPKTERTVLEAPLVRRAKIRNSDGHGSERLIVRLRFRIGTACRTGEFSLNNRKDLYHPVLLGRTVIRTLGLVDARRQYVATKGMD